MTAPFHLKQALPPQTPPSTQLSARNFILPARRSHSLASVPSASPLVDDDIDDLLDPEVLPRKRSRYITLDDISSDSEDENRPTQLSAFETPATKRPPVLLPQPTPEPPTLDHSPSRRQTFQPNGLVAYTAKIVQEHNALSSVAVPRLDQEVMRTITESHATEGGVGWICRTSSSDEPNVILLLRPKGLSVSKEVKEGDVIIVSNAVKLDTIWICASWHHKIV